MKLKRIAAAAAALAMAVSFASCEKEKSETESNPFDSEKHFEEKFKDVPDAESGPLLKIKDCEAAPGGVAEVTVSVTGAKDKWDLCGFHIIYPESLDAVNQREGEPDAKYTPGEAIADSSLKTAMEWLGPKTKEMIDRKVGSTFFTAAFVDDLGGDGDIVTLYLQIPEDADSGDEYPVDFYFYDTDVFKGSTNDMSFQKYAFTHWEGGVIKIK